MQQVIPGQSNKVTWDAVAKASGSAIVAGTVTFYLRARDGANAGKWFRASDSTWQAAESSAGTATHIAKALWELTIVAAAWLPGVTYDLYGVESGNLHIDYTEVLVTHSLPTTGGGAIAFTYTLTSTVDPFPPVPDADVWATSDLSGVNVIASGRTDANGQVTFYLDAGTVYVWRQKSGWNFVNPDTEVVS